MRNRPFGGRGNGALGWRHRTRHRYCTGLHRLRQIPKSASTARVPGRRCLCAHVSGSPVRSCSLAADATRRTCRGLAQRRLCRRGRDRAPHPYGVRDFRLLLGTLSRKGWSRCQVCSQPERRRTRSAGARCSGSVRGRGARRTRVLRGHGMGRQRRRPKTPGGAKGCLTQPATRVSDRCPEASRLLARLPARFQSDHRLVQGSAVIPRLPTRHRAPLWPSWPPMDCPASTRSRSIVVAVR